MSDLPRLSAKEAVILRLLIKGAEMYGLELVEKSDGQLGRGMIYTTLHRMSEKGLVTSRREKVTDELIGIPRRMYRITGLGQRTLSALEFASAQIAELAGEGSV